MGAKRWTVGKKLWLLTGLTALVLAAVEGYNAVSTKRLTAILDEVEHTQLPAVRAMALADMNHDGLRAVVYRAVIAAQTGSRSELDKAREEYNARSREIMQHLNDIQATDVSATIKGQVTEVTKNVDAYIKSGQRVFKLAEAMNVNEALRLLPEYQTAFQTLAEQLEKLGDAIEKQADEAVQRGDVTADQAEVWSWVIAFVGILSSLVFSALINRDLVKTLRSVAHRLDEQGDALKTYTDEIDGTAQNLSAASIEQASAVQETASAIEEINAMVARTAENSSHLAESARTSHHAVEDGRNAVQQMLGEMGTIQASNATVMTEIEQSNERIKNIVRVIGEIGEKTKIINDIVFQTKLLSFNASVEAARAGEHGKGFAVVAEEVGNLAQMSGGAAQEISQMLESGMRQVSEIVDSNRERISKLMLESAQKIENGKVAADKCGAVFTKIVEQVGDVTRLSSEISTAIHEQQAGLDEINKAVRMFNESTQVNSATARNAAQVSDNLQGSFKELSQLMAELRSLVRSESQA